MDPSQELKECAGTSVKLETKKKGKYREEIEDYWHRKGTRIYFTVLFRSHPYSPNQKREPEPLFSKPPDRTLRSPDTQSTGVCLGLAFNKGLGRNLEILLDCPLTSGLTHRQILPTIRSIIFHNLAFLNFGRWVRPRPILMGHRIPELVFFGIIYSKY